MFPQLFDTVPDALVVVDGAGLIAMANRQAERLFGYPPAGLTGLPVEQLIPEDARERHHSHRADYMRMPRTRPMGGAGMALVGQRRDGAQFPVEIALSPLQTDEGPRYLASIRDISETQRARQALVRARYDALVARIGQEAVELADEDALIRALIRARIRRPTSRGVIPGESSTSSTSAVRQPVGSIVRGWLSSSTTNPTATRPRCCR